MLKLITSASGPLDKSGSTNTNERKESSKSNSSGMFDLGLVRDNSKPNRDRLTSMSPIRETQSPTPVLVDLISKISRFRCPQCSHVFKSKCMLPNPAEVATTEIESNAVDLLAAFDQHEFTHEA